MSKRRESIEDALEAALLQSCRECQAIGYNPTAFKQMMGDMGGTGASKKLLNDSRLHDGFTRLWLLKARSDCRVPSAEPTIQDSVHGRGARCSSQQTPRLGVRSVQLRA